MREGLVVHDDVQVGLVVHPGAHAELAGVRVEGPVREVQVAVHLEAGHGHPDDAAVAAHHQVRGLVVAGRHAGARGAAHRHAG